MIAFGKKKVDIVKKAETNETKRGFEWRIVPRDSIEQKGEGNIMRALNESRETLNKSKILWSLVCALH